VNPLDGTIWYGDFAEGIVGHLNPATGEVKEWTDPSTKEGYAGAFQDLEIDRNQKIVDSKDSHVPVGHAMMQRAAWVAPPKPKQIGFHAWAPTDGRFGDRVNRPLRVPS
jgi:streptogramin lyase